MSESENAEENKINSVETLETKPDSGAGRSKTKPNTSISEGNIALQETRGAIPKLSKVISLNSNVNSEKSRERTKNDLLSSAMEGLIISSNNSEDDIVKHDWLKAKDSLEHVFYTKQDRGGTDVVNSKSTCCTTRADNFLTRESPHSESVLGTSKFNSANSLSKVLAWDPWEKLTRKQKKENKRKKFDKSPHMKENSASAVTQDQNRKDFKSGDEIRPTPDSTPEMQNFEENYEYQPYRPKSAKTVDFTNKVMVVYIKEDKVIGEDIEPLKKEVEQQIRNKEMRKRHMPDAPFNKKRKCD